MPVVFTGLTVKSTHFSSDNLNKSFHCWQEALRIFSGVFEAISLKMFTR